MNERDNNTPWTPDQRRAIETIGRSVIVSAAAGSGKTSVLAERCAYLVCDLPAQQRCSIDELVVVTFTEAAAAEMRARIRNAIHGRCARHPRDAHLQRQLLLSEEAHISTLHAFCLWLVRQYFVHVNIDASSPVIDEDESEMLLGDVLDRVIAARQAAGGRRTAAFRALIQHYAGGSEERLAEYTKGLYRFLRSLPDPPQWCDKARQAVLTDADSIANSECQLLHRELQRQIAGLGDTLASMDRYLPEGNSYADPLRDYLEMLSRWLAETTSDQNFEVCRLAIKEYAFKRTPGRRSKGAAAEARRLREQAKKAFDEIKKKWFAKRLQKRFALFSAAERAQGLGLIQPYVHTLIEVVEELDTQYQASKQRLSVLDYADLEHYAHDILYRAADLPSDVARHLHDKFAHVLVDEFQDINPIQDAILRGVSHECRPDLPDNLFTVGDIKQSIYRFRMAEPDMFLLRIQQAEAEPQLSQQVVLRKNFRSLPQITSAVNALFERLMTPALSGFAYDETAALDPGRVEEATPRPVTVHLIAGQQAPQDPDEEEDNEAAEASNIEQQAALIGGQIQDLVRAQQYDYRDVVVLLRAATRRAEYMVGVLQQLGVPTVADARTGFLGATEVSDMLALLDVLDNPYQDIPLAAVMRSGVSGMRFNESELLAVQRAAGSAPWHQGVIDMGHSHPDRDLRQRLQCFLEFLQRTRRLILRHPLPDVLWRIYEETNYLSYVLGCANGAQRHANLLMLHQRAAQFSHFRGQQGLFEFLRFIDRLREARQDLGSATPGTEADNVVRIMTIHTSKGLQFPVVFLANLEKPFNMQETRGSIIFDRQAHIALEVVDAQQRIRYPSLARERVKERLNRQIRAEELRMLYVGMTRAKDQLILVASTDLEQTGSRRQAVGSQPLGELHVLRARSQLDWIEQAMSCMDSEQVAWIDDTQGPITGQPTFVVQCHKSVSSAARQQPRQAEQQFCQRCADLEPLPPGAALPADEGRLDAVFTRLDAVYPHLALGGVPSVLNVTDFKRRLNHWGQDDDFSRQPSRRYSRLPRPAFVDHPGGVSAAEAGTATHTFLQHLDYADPARLAEQLQDMIHKGWLTAEQGKGVELGGIAWFLNTELGARVSAAAGDLCRELPFIIRTPVSDYDALLQGRDPEDFILVRGMVDLLLPVDGGYEVIDFKTDRISPEQVGARVDIYADQIRRYAMALENIWRRPVCQGHLVFLGPRQIKQVSSPLHPVNSTQPSRTSN